MAHVKVARRSMSLDQWSWLMFDQIAPLIVQDREPTDGWTVRIGEYEPEGYIWDGPARPIADGDLWGRPDGAAEFLGTAIVPDRMAGKPLHFAMQCAGEVIVSADGKMIDGIDPNRQRMPLIESAETGRTIALRLEAYSRSKPDDERNVATRAIRGCVQHFHLPHLEIIDPAAFRVHRQLAVLHAAAFGAEFSEDSKTWLQARVREAIRRMPTFECDPGEIAAVIPSLGEWLEETVFSGDHGLGHTGRLACVAHSHLDIAYHWRVRQTVQKNARTCLIQLRLLDRHPDFHFTHSQAWAYETLEQYYPELFEEVGKRIAEGRWEVVGGLYVEPDCNLISAESLARQILLGKRYFLEKFGIEVDNCWLPDVFGNSPVMPQILRAGGIRHFVSNKMSTWNDTNRFPHNHIRWRGIDGTDICACVPPTHFITWHDPNQWIEHWRSFIDKEQSTESLHMYGFGDGGSGVTDEMLEDFQWVRRLPEVPEGRISSAAGFLEKAFNDPDTLEVWDGELYLEMHRGTFTTKGWLKRENRRGEFMAYETELLCAMAAGSGQEYPAATLEAAWKKLLVNQFHDILPGSHTFPVYGDAMADYAAMKQGFQSAATAAWNGLTKAEEDAMSAFNPFSFARESILEVTGDFAALRDETGEIHPIQKVESPGGGPTRTVAESGPVPGTGARVYHPCDSVCPAVDNGPKAASSFLENRFFRLEFGAGGELKTLTDRVRGIDTLMPGRAGNEWQMFEDRPGNYNAWDLLDRFEDHPIAMPAWAEVTVVEQGPVTAALLLRREFCGSRAEQIVRIYRNIPRIDFETWIDWREEERLLKVAFPLRMRPTSFSTDTSAGVLERAVHRNTSWEQARFEVCCHKWARAAEGLLGFSILNDGKYGCDLRDSTLRLSLLRAPVRPDRTSDREEHRFTYSVFLDGGHWPSSGLVETAYDLNLPMQAIPGAWAATAPFVQTGSPALHLQSIKRAEDGSGDLVLRLIELYGSHGHATLRVAGPCSSAAQCDLLERPLRPLAAPPSGIPLDYRPYELITLRISSNGQSSLSQGLLGYDSNSGPEQASPQ